MPAHPRQASTSSWRQQVAPGTVAQLGRPSRAEVEDPLPRRRLQGDRRLAAVAVDPHGGHVGVVDDRPAQLPHGGAPLAQASPSREVRRSGHLLPQRGGGRDQARRPAHGAHVLVPRRPHVRGRTGDQRDRAVEEHRPARGLQTAVAAEDLAGHRRGGVGGRGRSGGPDGPREREHVGLQRHHHVVAVELRECLEFEGRQQQRRPGLLDSLAQDRFPAWIRCRAPPTRAPGAAPLGRCSSRLRPSARRHPCRLRPR